jgi:isoleucyl-tRNA synthetase
LYVGGVDSSVLSEHADLLKQEVNVKHVEVLSDPHRYVTRAVRLNTPDLGKRLKRRLQAVQSAVAAGDYVINQDGSLQAAGVVVLLDTIRNDRLWLEGDERDLNRTIQDLLKRARLRYSDRILLSISGPNLEALLSAFGPWLMQQALAVGLTTQLDNPPVTGSVRLGSSSAHVAIRLASSDRRGPTVESGVAAPE